MKQNTVVFLVVFFLLIYIYIYIYTLFTYVQNLFYFWATCGSAEQPLQVPGGKALSQTKPHPSDKSVKVLCDFQ